MVVSYNKYLMMEMTIFNKVKVSATKVLHKLSVKGLKRMGCPTLNNKVAVLMDMILMLVLSLLLAIEVNAWSKPMLAIDVGRWDTRQLP